MSKLTEALSQVKEALLAGEDPEAAVSEAADDYGLHPQLVLRKFTEANGSAPVDWIAAHRENERRAAELRFASLQHAVVKAQTIATEKWHVSGKHAELAGKIFKRRGKSYAWVAYVGDNPAYAIRAVDPDNGRVVTFPSNDWVDIMAQIAPDVRIVA